MLITCVRLDFKRKNGVDKFVDNLFCVFLSLYFNSIKIQLTCDRVFRVWFMKMEELYSKILSNIEAEVSTQSYYTWFSKLKPIYFDADKSIMRIQVPMGIHRITLKERYSKLINEATEQVYGKEIEYEYITEDELKEEVIEPFKEANIDEKIGIPEWQTNLKPEYTFDNYVVGDSNRLAYHSAQKVAEHPGELYNPLFIYGRSGIGKTHLMHAIGNYIVEHSNLKVLYVTSGDFVQEYVNIFKDHDNDKISDAQKFKDKYQNVDVLIVDDIQFIVNANQSQQEFFHTFNALYQKNKQIIISSDKSPNDLQKIEDRLRSRFMQGLPVDIYPPDLQLRCKIIRSKLRNNIEDESDTNIFSDEVIEYIANACTTDVRQIEGACKRVLTQAALFVPEKIDINFVSEALKSFVQVNIFAENSVSKIKRVVAEYYNIDVNDLRSKKRTATIARARQIAMYLCRMQTDEKLERIGMEFGKDHSTVSAAIDKITNELKTDVKLNTIVKELKNKL